MSDAVNGFGAIFSIHDGANPGAFVPVAEVFRIVPPGKSREAHEVTNFDSPGGDAEFIPGAVKTMAAFTVELNWTPGAETALYASFAVGSGRYRIALPSGGPSYTYDAIFTSLEPGPIEDDKRTLTCQFQPSGAEVIA